MSLGTIFVELDLSLEKWDRTNQTIIRNAQSTSLSVEKNWNILKTKSDRIFQAMANGAINAYNMITSRATTSAAEQFRAQSAMVARVNALNMQMQKNPLYETLGIKSQAAYKAQEKAIMDSYNTIKMSATASAEDIVRIEKAKNAKLKDLHKEMAGEHERSMAAMMRAVLRLYAAYFVVSNAIRGVFNVILDGIKAIDDLKISTISVAAQITSMQGPENVTENFKKNVEYAKELNVELQRIDAQSFANLTQIQRMNMALTNQGVLLNANNKSQMESFTALSNAIALFTQGQDKNRQAAQEIRALFTGQIRAGDMVARQMDALIKQQGVYAGGLKDLIKEGKKHGDTLERMQPYLIGIVEASGDIQKTWESVSSSLETSWRIIQRGMFKDIYKDVTEAGRKFTETLRTNEESIVKSIRNIYNAVAFAIKTTIALLVTFAATAWISAGRAGDAAAWFALRWEAMGARVTLATSKMSLGFGVFAAAVAGFSVGTLINNQFEIVRQIGLYVIHSLVEAWEWYKMRVMLTWDTIKLHAERVWAFVRRASDDEVNEINRRHGAIKAAIQQRYKDEKAIREQNLVELMQETTDGARAQAKALADIKRSIGPPEVGPPVPEPGAATTLMNSQLREFRRIMDAEVEAAQHAQRMRALLGENELKIVMDTLIAKKEALDKWNESSRASIENNIANEAEKNARLAAHDADYFGKKQSILNQMEEASLKLYMNLPGIAANFYKDLIGQEKEYRDNKLDWIDREAARLKNFYGEDFKQAKWVAEQKGKLEQDLFEQKTKQVDAALGDMSSAFSSIGNMYDKSSSQYAQMQDAAQAMIVIQKGLAVANAVAAIANQGLGDPYTAFVRIAAMAAAMGSLLGSIGMGIGGGGNYGAVGAAYGQNTTVFGGANNEASMSIANTMDLLEDTYDLQKLTLTGIYNSMKDLNANITGVVKGIVQGGTIGTPAGSVDFGTSISSGWMARTDTIAEGSGLNISSQNQSVRPYTDIYEKKHGDLFGLVGGSKKRWTEQGAIDQELTNLFFGPNGVYTTLRETMTILARDLGGDVAKAADYIFAELKINLKGKTSAEISEIISGEISAVADNMARTVLGTIIPLYQQVGEGAFETATRLAIDKAVVTDLLDSVGKSISGTVPEIIKLSESLIELAGGLDKLSEMTSVYYDKFFTDAEKQLKLENDLIGVFSSLNLVLPTTRDEYRSIVDALDLTTDAGQRAYISLLAAASAADDYYSVIDDQVDQLKSININLQKILDSLRGGALAPTDNFAVQQARLGQLFTTLSTSTDVGVLERATSELESFLPDFMKYATDYGLDYAQVSSGIARQIEDAMVRVELLRGEEGSPAITLSQAASELLTAATEFKKIAIDMGGEGEGSGLSQQIIDALSPILYEIIGADQPPIQVNLVVDGNVLGTVVADQFTRNWDLVNAANDAVPRSEE